MAHKQSIIELSHLEFCQYGKELAADLFMDIEKSSPSGRRKTPSHQNRVGITSVWVILQLFYSLCGHPDSIQNHWFLKKSYDWNSNKMICFQTRWYDFDSKTLFPTVLIVFCAKLIGKRVFWFPFCTDAHDSEFPLSRTTHNFHQHIKAWRFGVSWLHVESYAFSNGTKNRVYSQIHFLVPLLIA
jgi:hypothetical protein